MSILDNMGPKNEQELVEAWIVAAKMIKPTVDKYPLSERQMSVLELMQSGLSLADIFEIGKEERDALLVQGFQLLQVGEIKQAQDFFMVLHQLEPLDERVIYGFAASYQAAGDYAIAAKMYVNFIALDATNPEGHLRLAECFMAAKEYDNATESFEIALGEAARGGPGTADYARKMIGVVADMKRDAKLN